MCPTGHSRFSVFVGGLVAVLLPAGTIVYLFLFKMMSFMQSRLGPMEAGPYRFNAARLQKLASGFKRKTFNLNVQTSTFSV
jgi:NADH:ubiquinone oxidoreductase subunit H